MTDEISVEFEHATMQKGAVSLPSGLRDKAEIDGGVFAVDFPASESLVSNPTFRALVEAGHSPLDLPDEQAETVQRRLEAADPTDDASGGEESDSGDAADAEGDESASGELAGLDKSELYERAHEVAPDDAVPEWSPATKDELRDVIREHTE